MSISRVRLSAVSAVLVMASSVFVHADVIKQLSGNDFLIFEAEEYDSLESDEFVGWLEVGPDGDLESTNGNQILPPDSNVSGTAMYDQPDGSNLADLLNYKLQFAEAGIYTFYMRYSMFDHQDDTGYGNEDSIFLPLALDEPAEQDGWFGFPKLSHTDPLEDPPFWEGFFHWNDSPMDFEVDGIIEYEVTAADVGSVLDFQIATRERGSTLDAVVLSQDPALTPELLDEILEEFGGGGGGGGADQLQAGDADQDFDFDQLDLVKVQVAAKYLTGQAATWGEGDWNAAPGGEQGSPPPGNGLFDQLDIIAALANGLYLTGPYAAIAPGGNRSDGQTSIIYNADTGEVAVNSPVGGELTSINIDSAASIFTGASAENLGGSFDNDADNNIFKATFGSAFGSLSFGAVAQAGLSQDFVLNDLTVVGSLDGGGDLGAVDLIYVPEPSAVLLLVLGIVGLLAARRSR